MQKVEAIIRPFKLDEVRAALHKIGVHGMTLTKVFARQRSRTGPIDLIMVTLEIVMDEALVERAVQAIRQGARSGRIGDGHIFVSTVAHAVRIRTGETGTDAIS